MQWSKWLPAGISAVLVTFALVMPVSSAKQTQSSSPTRSASATPTPPGNAGSLPDLTGDPSLQLHESAAQKRTAPEFLVIIDPSHGGEDKGVVYSNRLMEKDLTLSFAREFRKELDERGIAAHLLRETDVSLPMEKRAELANSHHNAIYVAIHAGRAGQGVRVYSAALPAAAPNSGPFVAWAVAQSGSLSRSRILARAVVGELQKKKLAALGMDAPLRPLNNVTMPAIAVELAPSNDDARSRDGQSVPLKMQNAIASAVAAGIAISRGQMGVHP